MGKAAFTTVLLVPAVLGMMMSSYSYDRETLSIMPFVDSGKNTHFCSRCHTFTDRSSFQVVTNICDQMCRTCHRELEGHHKVGMKIGGKAPAVVKLRKDGTLACVSCHDLGGARWDGKAWKAQSLFGAMFMSGGKHRTYYLVERNNDGQLCGRCH
jgi:hypothetical protein